MSKSKSHGAALVELTISLPVMLLLMMAATELGRATVQYNTLTKGVRDAARYVAGQALLGTTGVVNIDATLAGEAQNLAVYGAIAQAAGLPILPGFQVSDVAVVDAGGGNITVTATYAYQPLLAANLPTFGTGAGRSMTFNMQATVTMRAI